DAEVRGRRHGPGDGDVRRFVQRLNADGTVALDYRPRIDVGVGRIIDQGDREGPGEAERARLAAGLAEREVEGPGGRVDRDPRVAELVLRPGRLARVEGPRDAVGGVLRTVGELEALR